jgi:glycosyltransferase involved in cell wall biosynthesis
MKLLLVTPYYYPKIGGLEIYARQLALALHERHQVEITVVTSNHRGYRTSVETIDGMTVYRLGTWFKLSNTPVNPLWSLQLRRLVRSIMPDVIHAHTPVPTMADAAALASGSTPFVLTYHAATLQKGNSRLFNLLAYLYGRYERLTFCRAVRIIAVSPYVKTALPARVQSKSAVITNAVWSSTIKERIQPATAPLIFIGSLDRTHAWKGLDLILQSVALTPDARLIIVGDGNDRSRYERLSAELGIAARVEFRGALTGSLKDLALAEAMALIAYPTTANDAFPTVFLEAWAAGVPVIAASIGALTDLIKTGTGYLVPPYDPDALAAVITSVTSDLDTRQRVVKTATLMLRDNYTWERQSDAMFAQLEALL